jgi:phage terminase large subunit GpA-like protein
LPGLYPRWVTWADLAVEHAKKRTSTEGVQDFQNSVLGLPVKVQVANATLPQVLEHRQDYAPGECPQEPVTIILTADAQDNDVFYWVVRAWGAEEQSWLLGYGKAESKEQLRAEARRLYRTPVGDFAPLHRAIDSGAFADDIYQFCRADPKQRWTPLKGVNRRESATHGRQSKDVAGLFLVNTYYCRQALSNIIAKKPGTPGYWALHARADGEYAKHMTAERAVVLRDKSNRPYIDWQPVEGRPNHWWDCEVYQVCAMRELRVRGQKTRLGRSP